MKYTIISDVGCKSDTVPHTVVLNDPPVAGFTVAGLIVRARRLHSKIASVPNGSSTIVKWTWNFGDGFSCSHRIY
ncbi:MAG: hypothetical protein WDN26_11400 [Chitinophagaceae bacterium]